MRRAILVVALLVGCDPADVVVAPDADVVEPDAAYVDSVLCWERCAGDDWLEPWPPEDPDHVICHDLGTTCALLACDDLLAEGYCDATELWCPPSYNGGCWCNSLEDNEPDAWCRR